jgi:2-polyprenyl-6-methoxyphenol hydroxylase-like FAD-dependent oxidoreductase
MDVIIAGGGIGGFTTALALHAQGVRNIRVFEAAAQIKPLGLGINIQPHASRELVKLGLLPAMKASGVETLERASFTHHGQLVYREPTGVHAGYPYPQFSFHRGELLMLLYRAAQARIGARNIVCGHRAVAVEQDGDRPLVRFVDANGQALAPATGDVVIAADGIHSNVRKQFYPDEGEPRFHGINMWRGVTRAEPFLTGKTTARIGGLHATGKMVVYPILDDIDGQGTQLINWNLDVVSQTHGPIDWGQPGRLEDVFPLIEDWRFDWLDIAALVTGAEFITTFPMVDRDPIARWAFGHAVLVGDAAHPMFPRGGNGGASAILDAASIARHLTTQPSIADALKAFEAERSPITSKIVEENRTRPPDHLIDIVEQRTKGRKFANLDDVISQSELHALSETYKRIARSDLASVTP